MSKQDRKQLKQQYGELFDQVSAALFAADPIGINFGSNTDEYDPEAGTIIPRLRDCRCKEDVVEVVYQEFVKWFDTEIAGPKERYEKVAETIWQLWNRNWTTATSDFS